MNNTRPYNKPHLRIGDVIRVARRTGPKEDKYWLGPFIVEQVATDYLWVKPPFGEPTFMHHRKLRIEILARAE